MLESWGSVDCWRSLPWAVSLIYHVCYVSKDSFYISRIHGWVEGNNILNTLTLYLLILWIETPRLVYFSKRAANTATYWKIGNQLNSIRAHIMDTMQFALYIYIAAGVLWKHILPHKCYKARVVASASYCMSCWKPALCLHLF